MRDRVDTRVGRQRPERASLHLSAIAAERLHRASVLTGRPMSHLIDELAKRLPLPASKTAQVRSALVADPRRTNVAITKLLRCSEHLVGRTRRDMEADGVLTERRTWSRRAGQPLASSRSDRCISVSAAFYALARTRSVATGVPLRQLVERGLKRHLPAIGGAA